MKIVMVTINPLFADKVIGGSTKHLRQVACALGEQGHDVTILSTIRHDSTQPMHWHAQVVVKPSFVFKQPFPLPYDVPAFEMAKNIQHVVDALQGADRLYFHDGEFLFPPLGHTVPTVVSLRDCVYPETMLGSFLFDADAMITLSNYCRDTLLVTAGRFLQDLPARTVVITNGFDWDFYRPTPPSAELLFLVRVDPAKHTIVLHPHRPELSKGLRQTIETVHRLVHRHGFKNLKVLVPSWFDEKQTPDMAEFLDGIERELAERGLGEVFVFHDWLPQRLMPEYYSLGSVTLVLGSFVEAFGNTAYESLGCGTPAIVSRVSSNRILMPDDLLAKVHFDDNDKAAELAANFLHTRQRTSEKAHAYLQSQFGIAQQVEAYSRVILNATKQPAMRYRFTSSAEHTTFTLAPWCEVHGDFVYHDYRADHRRDKLLASLAQQLREGRTQGEVNTTTWAEWITRGYIVATTNELKALSPGQRYPNR